VTVTERPATRADLAAVLQLWLAFDVEVRGFPDSDETDVLGDWDVPGFDLGRQTLVLEDDGALVGYAVVSGDETDSTVHPDRFGQGLEERLLAWIEGAAEPGLRVHHYSPVSLLALQDAFAARGWEPARRFWRMRIDHSGPGAVPEWPAGVSVRDFDLDGDARLAHRMVQDCFADIGSHTERSWDEWSVAMLAPERFDPALYLVAVEGDEVVGLCLSQDLTDYGFVRQLAVPRPHRTRGIGRALLHESFARHRARGLTQTQLGVDSDNASGATRLYESVGMRISEDFTRWEKTV
jgi:mycothiol synthase